MASDLMLERIAACRAAQLKSVAVVRSGVYSTALTSKERAALDRVIGREDYLHRAYLNGLWVKAGLIAKMMPSLPEGPFEGGAKTMIMFLHFEQAEAVRALRLDDLQGQAWRFLYDKSRCFPRELLIPAGGSIAQGRFTGFKAFEELCTLIRIAQPASAEELMERMREDGGKRAEEAFCWTLGTNMLAREISTNAAVALTSFGGQSVLEILDRILQEKNDDGEQHEIVDQLIKKIASYSPFCLGVMYPQENLTIGGRNTNPPEEIKDDLNTLRYSGYAWEINRRLDGFHDDQANSKYFRKIVTKLPDSGETLMDSIFHRTET